MEIRSGGTPGPRLAEPWDELDNNVYGALSGTPPVKPLAEWFVAAGWRARASSWTEYQVEQEWVRIELIQSADEVIFCGVIDPSRLTDLTAVFAAQGWHYSVELYNEDRTELLQELEG